LTDDREADTVAARYGPLDAAAGTGATDVRSDRHDHHLG
jgi:hypothetical protein